MKEPEDVVNEFVRQMQGAMNTVPIVLGNAGLSFALENFQRQGFLGYTLERWQSRKQGWKKDKRTGRSILVDTGRLRRAGRIVYVNRDGVVLGWDVPYARAHNEGLRIGLIQSVKAHTRGRFQSDEVSAPGARSLKFASTKVGDSSVKAHTRKIDQNIPRRQYIGDSPYLRAKMVREGSAHFMKHIRYTNA